MSSIKLIMISWDRCCYPKKEGKLGIKKLGLMNKALVTKLAASIFEARDGVLQFLRFRFVSKVNLPRRVLS